MICSLSSISRCCFNNRLSSTKWGIVIFLTFMLSSLLFWINPSGFTGRLSRWGLWSIDDTTPWNLGNLTGPLVLWYDICWFLRWIFCEPKRFPSDRQPGLSLGVARFLVIEGLLRFSSLLWGRICGTRRLSSDWLRSWESFTLSS